VGVALRLRFSSGIRLLVIAMTINFAGADDLTQSEAQAGTASGP
jgi:hypothetical protein